MHLFATFILRFAMVNRLERAVCHGHDEVCHELTGGRRVTAEVSRSATTRNVVRARPRAHTSTLFAVAIQSERTAKLAARVRTWLTRGPGTPSPAGPLGRGWPVRKRRRRAAEDAP